jgi:hypothetical protein
VERGARSHDVLGLDLRSLKTARRCVESAHRLMLRAIAAAKKKNDRIEQAQVGLTEIMGCQDLRVFVILDCFDPLSTSIFDSPISFTALPPIPGPANSMSL